MPLQPALKIIMNNFFEYLKKEENLHYHQTADLIEVISDFVRLHHPEVYVFIIEEFKKHSLTTEPGQPSSMEDSE